MLQLLLTSVDIAPSPSDLDDKADDGLDPSK